MATKLYFNSQEAPSLKPTAFSGDWTHTTDASSGLSSFVRRMSTTKAGTPMVDLGVQGDGADHLVLGHTLCVQLVSAPLAAQTITNNRIKIQARYRHPNSASNETISMKLFLIDGNGVAGSTLMALTNVANTGVPPEFVVAPTTHTNRSFNVVMTAGPVSASLNDRIVLELGCGGTPIAGAGTNGHNCGLIIGDDSGTDLPEDETTTAANNPWLQFGTDTITFLSELAPPPLMHRPHRFFNRRF
jgi:hypothetical protein